MGKHIVISREGGDFSMDLIFAGLVRRFGKENVIDWPPREKHRQGKPVLTGDDEGDYGAERRSLCYVEGCEDLREWDRHEIIGELAVSKIDRVWVDETRESFEDLNFLTAVVTASPRVVIIAGHDHLRTPIRTLGEWYGTKIEKIFIDDWQSTYDNYDGYLNLINLSCNFDHLWEVEKRDEYLQNKLYDVCFIGYNSNPVRKVVIDHVRQNWGYLNSYIILEERPNRFDAFVRHDEMFRLIAQSKICLNLPGASTGGRALRYYEIPYVGSWMISQWFPARLLYPMPCGIFEPGDLDKLDDLIANAIYHPEEREQKAKKLHDHCMKYHTIDARMDYIFEVLDGQTAAV